MVTRAKVHGHNDSQSLQEAVRTNERVTMIMRRILARLNPPPASIAALMTEAGLLLSSQRSALATMERIRAEQKEKKSSKS